MVCSGLFVGGLLVSAVSAFTVVDPSQSSLLSRGRRTASRSSLQMALDKPILTIGTRGSMLALAQAHETKRRLGEKFPELAEEGAIELKVISTTGDERLEIALSEIGGKGLFTKELDVALLTKQVDICVHSMKDVPTWLVDGTILPVNLPREDTRDVFISKVAKRIEDLPEGAVVGTASLRRAAQVLYKNPKVKVVNFRGNVQTRLRKLDEKQVDATMLALAGLNRLGMTDVATSVLDHDEILPAVSQGAIGIQCRADDERVQKYIAPLGCAKTKAAVDCERAFLGGLDGNCRTPIAGHAFITEDGRLKFKGMVSSMDGSEFFYVEKEGAVEDGPKMGKEAADEITAQCGEEFLEKLRAATPHNTLPSPHMYEATA
uniref:hydroxymethylbilane synthase n=2 Tax=Chromera velia TaxID=505693 RepID=G4W922_9ALVE|nr:porphobilinogen deaminase [Chromera velia]|eukprot:Cvel_26028.t1-p1 / transcript=Cvel_26028.t1 / gene=Cvel_26028 / organism=Chromera_velia_CCMP2878 / gene_product=Porphobilinogen deaminase, chloroplastic, putative / transcript_product=Porphobilinogen deaminase, chloroplastic, putative / location=Cvel_scaffold3032:3500-5923(+) / protein_length=375 / sequence_SO=supercontig / SO=protein_coding / is_pseudo=false